MRTTTTLEVATDPNVTAEQLEALWTEHPEEVLANPALPLLLLENPAWTLPAQVLRLVLVRRYREGSWSGRTSLLAWLLSEKGGWGDCYVHGNAYGDGLGDGSGFGTPLGKGYSYISNKIVFHRHFTQKG